jgi:phospholipid transport system substrate-binding protein
MLGLHPVIQAAGCLRHTSPPEDRLFVHSFPFRALAIALAALALLPARAGADSASPSEVIRRIDDTLIGVMREAKDLGFAGREERLAPVMNESFDFPFMAAVSVGRHWRKLDDAQRKRLVDTFARMSVATFAARFDGYSGEHFEVKGEQPGPRSAVLVRNDLIKSDGEAVPINYLLRQRQGEWRVVDVFLDAKYSELALKRSEYSSVIEKDGLEALLASLEDHIKKLAAEE